MRIECDHQADAVYIYLTSQKDKIWKSREVQPGVVLDLNKKKNVIGIEVLDVSRRFKPSELFQFSVKHVGELVGTASDFRTTSYTQGGLQSRESREYNFSEINFKRRIKNMRERQTSNPERPEGIGAALGQEAVDEVLEMKKAQKESAENLATLRQAADLFAQIERVQTLHTQFVEIPKAVERLVKRWSTDKRFADELDHAEGEAQHDPVSDFSDITGIPKSVLSAKYGGRDKPGDVKENAGARLKALAMEAVRNPTNENIWHVRKMADRIEATLGALQEYLDENRDYRDKLIEKYGTLEKVPSRIRTSLNYKEFADQHLAEIERRGEKLRK